MSRIERLLKSATELEPDAQKVLCLIAERLLVGQKHYGRLSLRSDKRNWDQEALEEDADGLIYRSIATLQQMRRTKRKR